MTTSLIFITYLIASVVVLNFFVHFWKISNTKVPTGSGFLITLLLTFSVGIGQINIPILVVVQCIFVR